MTGIEVRNPATGEISGRVAVAAPGSVRQAALRARAAQQRWAAASLRSRRRVLLRFHDLLFDRDAAILDTIQSETGKSRRDAFCEILTVAGTARYYAWHGPEHTRPRRHRGAVPGLTSARSCWRPHPLVGCITPWNYPFLLAIADALPALMGGSAVLVKPSEKTPLSAELGRSLLVEAGLDPPLFGLVQGYGEEALALVDEVDYVAFTGGPEAGRAVAARAGDRLIGCSLELGGKNAMLVLEGARVDDAVGSLMGAAYANSGQACIGIERVYVVDSLYEAFVARAAERVRALRVGWSRDWAVDVGSLISAGHAAGVLGVIEDAASGGARILAGGRARPDLGPAFLEPTLLAEAPRNSAVCLRETFGPVVSVVRVRDAAEAVARTNDSPYGLNASVWGRGARVEADRLRAGSVGLNSALQIYGTFDAPMGGLGLSGFGRRHGEEGIRRFGASRTLVAGPSRGGGYDALWSALAGPRPVHWMKRFYRLWARTPGIR